NPAQSRNRNHQALRSGQRICGAAQALDRRAHDCLAQPLSKTRQGLGKPQSQGPRIPASRFDPPHAAKTMQSRLMFPDRLLESGRLELRCGTDELKKSKNTE